MSKIVDMVGRIIDAVDVFSFFIVLIGIFIGFLFLGGKLIYELYLFYSSLDMETIFNFKTIILILLSIFLIFIIIYGAYTWAKKQFCSHVWEELSDSHSRCVKCGKDVEIYTDDYKSLRDLRIF